MNQNLFESWARFGQFQGGKKIKKLYLRVCFLLLNKEKLTFKSQQLTIIQEILLREIISLVKERSGRGDYLKITTSAEQSFVFCVVYLGSKKPDNYKTGQLYSLLLSLEGLEVNSEQQIIDKLKSMLQVSPKINITVLKEVLGVESSIFYQNIYNLAAKLELTVDGDYLKVDKISVSEFIRTLNEYFKLGISDEMLIEEKLSCPYCGSPIKLNDKFCTQCGTTLIKDENEEKQE